MVDWLCLVRELHSIDYVEMASIF